MAAPVMDGKIVSVRMSYALADRVAAAAAEGGVTVSEFLAAAAQAALAGPTGLSQSHNRRQSRSAPADGPGLNGHHVWPAETAALDATRMAEMSPPMKMR